ncbi:hypothetical protein Bca4012_060725 [Brassica carinata]
MMKHHLSNVKHLSSNLQKDHRRSLMDVESSATRNSRVGPATTQPPYEFRYASETSHPSCHDFQICKLRVGKTIPRASTSKNRADETKKGKRFITLHLQNPKTPTLPEASPITRLAAAPDPPSVSSSLSLPRTEKIQRPPLKPESTSISPGIEPPLKEQKENEIEGLRGTSDAGREHRPPGEVAAVRLQMGQEKPRQMMLQRQQVSDLTLEDLVTHQRQLH